jgi:hypothetical protein
MNWCINIQLPMPKKLYQYSIAVDNGIAAFVAALMASNTGFGAM